MRRVGLQLSRIIVYDSEILVKIKARTNVEETGRKRKKKEKIQLLLSASTVVLLLKDKIWCNISI